MKKIFTLLALLSITYQIALAQITYTSSDYAVAGDSILVSEAVIDSLGADNFQLTGTNFSWNYTNLFPHTQFYDQYLSAGSTGYKLTYVTSCVAGGGGLLACNNKWNSLVNLGHQELDSLKIGTFEFSNVIDHYFKSTEALPINILGMTLGLNGVNVPLAIPYTVPDTVYRFPLAYGNKDSCTSKYAIDLTSSGVDFIYKVQTKRVNDVDGWGALTTPFKDFLSTIKLKTYLYFNDTLIFNGDTIPIPSTEQVIYSWFENASIIPVLAATGNMVNGNVIYTEIDYTDTTRCLSPQALFTTSPLVIYLNTGTQTAPVDFSNTSVNANVFEWNFDDPGSGAENTSSLLNPSHTYSAAGTYKVQLIAGNTLCSPLRYDTIVESIVILDSSNAQANFTFTPLQPCADDTVHFTNTSINSTTYTWNFGDGTNSVLKNPAHIYLTASTYTITLIAKSSTQSDTTQMQVVVSATPVAVITPSGTINSCMGDSVILYASGGSFYQWSDGRVTDSIIVKNAGTYSVKAFNNCGSNTSSAVTVNFSAPVVPAVSVMATPPGAICSGTTVTFTAITANGGTTPSYQWEINGAKAGTNSGTFTTSALANGNIISCVLTSSLSCVTQPTAADSIAMTVNPLVTPTVTIRARPGSTICSGTPVTFIAITNDGSPLFQWKKNGINVGSNSDSYIDDALANNDLVWCILTSSFTCASPAKVPSDTVKMSVTLPYNTNLDAAICSGATYNFNGTILSKSGIYPDSLKSSGGCDSVVTLTLIVATDTVPAINQIGFDTLSSSPANSYQWILDSAAINGATHETYIATKNGNYKVAITNSYGCPDTSVVFPFINTAVSGIAGPSPFRIYPNPANQSITVEISPDTYDINIVDVAGRKVYETGNSVQQVQINCSDFPAGIYFVRAFTSNSVLVQKMIISH